MTKMNASRQISILLVDDDDDLRSSLSEYLAAQQYHVIQAENGLVAVGNYMCYNPDIILMDVNMPKMNGYDALKKIKDIDHHAKVILMSAYVELFNLQKYSDDTLQIIQKPFSLKKLLNLIELCSVDSISN